MMLNNNASQIKAHTIIKTVTIRAQKTMSQIKIYALNETIELHRIELSKAIHQALVKELNCPEKRFFNDLYLQSLKILFTQRIDPDLRPLSRFECLKEEQRDQESIYLGFI